MFQQKAKFPFALALYLVSVLALISNIIFIFFISISQKLTGKSPLKLSCIIRDNIWKLGRNPKHYSSIFVDRFNKLNHWCKVNAASSEVLNLFYNYEYSQSNGSLWIGKMNNSRGVANRRRIITKKLTQLILDCPKSEVKFLSLASGSAEAVIAAIKAVPEKKVWVTLIDADEKALAQAKKLALINGLSAQFKFQTANVFRAVSQVENADIIEMAGFADYVRDETLIKLFGRIRERLNPGGKFVTCNIVPNREKIFLDWVLLWPMYYRRPAKLGQLLAQSGFNPEIEVEPLKTHAIAVCA